MHRSILLFAFLIQGCSSLSSKTTEQASQKVGSSGWKSRPVSPEIQEQFSAKKEADSRRPWEFGRFISQSSKFVATPFTPKPKQTIRPGVVLFEPSGSGNTFRLAPLDDVVMGGASSSQFDNASGKWTGKVTDANNGGFVGIRTTPNFEFDMTQCQGLQFTFRGGGGNRYKIGLRDSTDFNGVVWTTSADIGKKNKNFFGNNSVGSTTSTTTVKIPFAKMTPTIFAKTVPNQTFQASTVAAFQVAYSKFEYDGDLNNNFELGDVDLQIVDISAY